MADLSFLNDLYGPRRQASFMDSSQSSSTPIVGGLLGKVLKNKNFIGNASTPLLGGLVGKAVQNPEFMGGIAGGLLSKLLPKRENNNIEPKPEVEQVEQDSLIGNPFQAKNQADTTMTPSLSNYYSNINLPGRQDYSGVKSKIERVSELSKRKPVEPETGFSKGEKWGIGLNAVGNLIDAIGESRDESGTMPIRSNEGPGLSDILAKKEADRRLKYDADVMNRGYESDMAQNDISNEMTLSKLMGQGDQQSFANQLALAQARQGEDYKNQYLNSMASKSIMPKAPSAAVLKYIDQKKSSWLPFGIGDPSLDEVYREAYYQTNPNLKLYEQMLLKQLANTQE